MNVSLSREALRLCLSEQLQRHDISEVERLTKKHQQLTRDLQAVEQQLLEAYQRVKQLN
jgi:hypothetical protein